MGATYVFFGLLAGSVMFSIAISQIAFAGSIAIATVGLLKGGSGGLSYLTDAEWSDRLGTGFVGALLYNNFVARVVDGIQFDLEM